MRRFFPLGIALVLVACTVVEQQPTPPGPVAPPPRFEASADMTAKLLANRPPLADPFDLTRRLRGRDGQPGSARQPVRASARNETVGTSAQFWTYDFDQKKNVRVTATLRLLTDHARWWIAEGVTVDTSALRATADVFETKVYPTNRRSYGEEWSPGIDNDPHIDVLVARIPGRAAGYYSSPDELPSWVNQFSAEREMIYVNSIAARFGSDNLASVLAHEYCHMIQFNKPRPSSVWFDEGHAQLCELANGYPNGFAQSFLRQADTQFDAWPNEDVGGANAYGGAFMFLEFLREHAGGEDLINAFLAAGIDTAADMDRVLQARGQASFEQLFSDYVAANALLGLTNDRRFAYSLPFRLSPAVPVASDKVTLGGTFRGSVHNQAARYVELPRAAMKVTFDGAKASRVIPTDPHSGKSFWWTDRADGIDSRLTRAIDLRNVKGATLTFWTWYEIEADFDYMYVAASGDGGAKWTTLATPATTTSDPNGGNLGNGFTGMSGGGTTPAWTQQKVDLSAYDGKEILLSFEYVTDPALNLNGAAIDDVEIVGVFRDDMESDNGWQAAGFIRSTNVVAQRYAVQVIRFGTSPTVEQKTVTSGTLELELDTSADSRAPLLAVTGFAPRSTEPTSFEVGVRSR